ncbi:hypothetical protein ANN_14313 [Periplaneta americana]|uniref:Uncharacterized protein n=1 Tax=Periplaneta americana TaxID=6978 RepID=A0ABQ8SW00_PERAM|nr:hypothetical protein ANN_14313 [Periplaneta americana]
MFICQPVGSVLSGIVLEQLGRKKSMIPGQLPARHRLVHLLLRQLHPDAVRVERNHGARRRLHGGTNHHVCRRDQPARAAGHAHIVLRQVPPPSPSSPFTA